MQKLFASLCLSILLAQLQTISGPSDSSRTRGRPTTDRSGDRTSPPSPTIDTNTQAETPVAPPIENPEPPVQQGAVANPDGKPLSEVTPTND